MKVIMIEKSNLENKKVFEDVRSVRIHDKSIYIGVNKIVHTSEIIEFEFILDNYIVGIKNS
jgi:hypothetical protein